MPKTVNPNVAWICGTVILLVVLGGIFTLVWHGSIPGVVALTVVGTIAAAVLTALGVKTAVTTAMTVQQALAAEREHPPE